MSASRVARIRVVLRAVVLLLAVPLLTAACQLVLGRDINPFVAACIVTSERFDADISSVNGRLVLDVRGFGGKADGADPRMARWQTVSETTAGIALPIPAGTVTFSGTVTSADGGAFSTPRKMLVRLDHLDAQGTRQARFQAVLKFKNGLIKQTERPFPGFDLQAGDRVRTLVKVAGPDMSPETTFELRYRYSMDFTNGMLTYLRQLPTTPLRTARIPGLARFAQRIPEGARQVVLDHAFGDGATFEPDTLVFDGYFFPAAERNSDARAARVPTSLRFTLRQVDELGQTVTEVAFTSAIGGTRLERVEVPMAGFAFAQGHRFQMLVQPVGGDIEDADGVALNFNMS